MLTRGCVRWTRRELQLRCRGSTLAPAAASLAATDGSGKHDRPNVRCGAVCCPGVFPESGRPEQRRAGLGGVVVGECHRALLSSSPGELARPRGSLATAFRRGVSGSIARFSVTGRLS